MMRIVLLGPPGAGKGTQARVLAEKIKVAHISTGDLLRQNVSVGSDLGREAKGYMEKGALVPDTLVNRMLARRFDDPDIKKGFILDGYPRNLKQAESLDEILKERNSGIDLVFYLDTSEKVILQRLTGRRVCKGCGANFHVKNMPPKKDGICDNCGGVLYQRSDDNEATIRNRLEVYKNESAPLIDYYSSSGKLKSLNADGEAGIVLDEMVRLIKS
jgi:adenylate kinase